MKGGWSLHKKQIKNSLLYQYNETELPASWRRLENCYSQNPQAMKDSTAETDSLKR